NNGSDILKTKVDCEDEKYIFINLNEDEKSVIIEIQDSGGGIPKGIISKVFEPYFTTKHQSKGTGLGLYMTHKIVEDNLKGSIFVENCKFAYKGKSYFGAKFTIKIPKVLKI
ncbi:MAG: HAMP domain-containing sensor histidine kinase, partial [Campylobacterota bacterium]|nr:HAMP domain-containing sensor histidine kinase [Campylobacterota bacterium]